MRCRALAVLAIALIGCARDAAPKKPRARREPRSAFALRPLSIAVEGTSERRAFPDPVFIGIHATVTPWEGNRQSFASAMTRFMRLPVTPAPNVTQGCEHLWGHCMAPLGKRLGARFLVWGVATFNGGEVGVIARALDVEHDAVVASYREELPLDRADPEALRDMIERARHAVLASADSVLLVETDIEGTIVLDTDRRVPLVRPRTRIPVEKGFHVFAVVARGYAKTQRVVEVPAGYFVRVVVKK